MFKITIDCPKGSASSVSCCEGSRKDGTLKNDCAFCPAYRKYLQEKFPGVGIPAQTNI